MNMMRKNNNRGGNKHRGNSGGRRYNNNGGGNRGQNDGQNLQRQKHHATQQLGKYNDLARNAQINGDRVDVEYYLQHVDHYSRVLADIAVIEVERHAHHRETYQQQAQSSAQEQGGQAPADVATNEHNEASSAATTHEASEPVAPPVERVRHRRAQQPSDNGAREANANTTDIPLPGNILPPI